MGQNVDLDLDLDLTKSKHDHERGQYLTDFDDFGLVEQLRVRAFHRRPNHQNPSGIDPVQDHVLIWPQVQVQVQIFSGPCNQVLISKKRHNNRTATSIFRYMMSSSVIAL